MPPFLPASPSSVAAFVCIVAAVVGAFLAGVWHAWRHDPAAARQVSFRVALVLAAWLGATAAVVGSGRMPDLPMAGLPFFFGSIVVIGTGAGLSRFGGKLATAVPIAALVAFQGFRLPLELVLHSWVNQGTIPQTMTWTGQNWDILSGIAALVCAPLASRSRAAAWAANGIGAVLLLNVMRVALLSAPVPFGWQLDRPLLVALHLPYALIGPVCVGGALFGHIVLTRALFRKADHVEAGS